MYVTVMDSMAESVFLSTVKKPNPVKGPTLRSMSAVFLNLKIKEVLECRRNFIRTIEVSSFLAKTISNLFLNSDVYYI